MLSTTFFCLLNIPAIFLNFPVPWLATYSLAVIDNTTNEYTFLLNKDVNFIRQSFPDTDTAHYGKPQYYAVFDDTTFILGPTPDKGYGAELHYFYYLNNHRYYHLYQLI